LNGLFSIEGAIQKDQQAVFLRSVLVKWNLAWINVMHLS